jgi:hypothetical protein
MASWIRHAPAQELGVSLSLRERVGVRGNPAFDFPHRAVWQMAL